VLVGRKRLDYSADTTFGPGQSNWATTRRLAGGAEGRPSLGNRARAKVRGTRAMATSSESQEARRTSRTRSGCGEESWRCRRQAQRQRRRRQRRRRPDGIVSRSPDFTARKALELGGECVMQLASAPGCSTGVQAPGLLPSGAPQQTAILAQGSSCPEYFRCHIIFASTCSSQEAAMCVCDQQRCLHHSSRLGCSCSARGPQLSPRLPVAIVLSTLHCTLYTMGLLCWWNLPQLPSRSIYNMLSTGPASFRLAEIECRAPMACGFHIN
jgi:hypothetical protein